MGYPQRPTATFRGGFTPAARLPFLPLMEEKEAKEDQGDDRHQVGRIGAEIAAWFHGMQAMARRDPWGRAQKKPDTGSRRRSASIRPKGLR